MGSLARKVQCVPLEMLHGLTLDSGRLGELHFLVLAPHRFLAAGVELRVCIPIPFRTDRLYGLHTFRFAAGV